MEILSPLTKLLRWERAPDLSPRTGGGQGSSSKIATVKDTQDLSTYSVFRQLYALSPKDLQRFVAQYLPFWNDPYFSKRLAQAITSWRVQGASGSEGFEKMSESHLVRDNAGGLWKAWIVPVAIEGRLTKVTIYLSRKQQKKDKKRHSRIVFATELDHTGPIEIEADVSETSLFLALRSTSSFSALAQTSIRERFLQILEAVRMHGSINFYTVSHLPMATLEPQTAWEVEL